MNWKKNTWLRGKILARRNSGFVEELCWSRVALYYARRLSEHLGGSRIYLKREDLNHTGAHKINNTIDKPAGKANGQDEVD